MISTSLHPIDYKDTHLLCRYIGTTGKILPRRITGLSAKKHRNLAKAIRRARRTGMIPFVWVND